MTNDNKVASLDIEQYTYEPDARAKKAVAIVKTTDGSFINLAVGTDGSLT